MYWNILPIMSRFSEQSQDLNSSAPEDKKIFFRGLEKCLEAFTSEGRVVRKYARLFSQLNGNRLEEDDEAISWSSSDEDARGGSSHNTSVSRRSRVTRKLNSQINFESRINAKKNGRRLTSAVFSRSVEHLPKDPFGINSETLPLDQIPNQISLAEPGGSSSIFNTGILIDQSNNLTVPSENLQDERGSPPLPLTPHPKTSTSDSDITSPVFKLNASATRHARKFRPKCNSRIENGKNGTSGACREDEVEKLVYVPEPLPSVNANTCASPHQEQLQLTPETQTVNENCGVTSPILGRSVLGGHEVISPSVLNGAGASSSPVMRKTTRRKRPHNTIVPIPASPILEPKKRNFTSKRKRRKLTTSKSASQSRNDSSDPGISDLFLNDTHFTGFDTSKCIVKRSLDFTLDKSDHDHSLTKARSDDRIEPLIEASAKSAKTTDRLLSLKNPCVNVLGPLRYTGGERSDFPRDDSSEGIGSILNATNIIEEVYTEELHLSTLPKAVSNNKKNRLSLGKAVSKKNGTVGLATSPEAIEENSQTQRLIGFEVTEKPDTRTFKVPKCPAEKPNIAPKQKSDLNQTNLIEEVYTEELDISVLVKAPKGILMENEDASSSTFEEVRSPHREDRDFQTGAPNGVMIDENSQPQVTLCLPSSPGIQVVNGRAAKSKGTSKSFMEMRTEFRGNCSPDSRDQELFISQSSSRSGDPLKCRETESPDIESVSSQASRETKDKSGPSTGAIPKSNAIRYPCMSSPLVISSAGSSPDVKSADLPFVITEDEYNAPPKRRNKKLDPNGIAIRLQRLLNQRRSAARIWQYKRSKLSRLNNEEEGRAVEESHGRVLTVLTVRTDYSHIVLLSKAGVGENSNKKEFGGNVAVILDPGVVLRLGKVMNATRIKIFPPWQSMDLKDRDITVILGANIIEVLSTEPETNSPNDLSETSAAVKKYACQCLSPFPPDAVTLECWDGVQSIGLLDILFPLDAPPLTQLVQFDENMLQTLQCLDHNNSKREQSKYTIRALISTQSTTSHGKCLLVLTVLRVLCYWQRSLGLTSKRETLPHWSIFGQDDSNEVCELVLGQIQNFETETRLDWSDFITGESVGKKYKFRGVAVSRRLNRLRHCGEWGVVPDQQKIIYVLVPSSQFSFSNEDPVSKPCSWEPEITTLASHIYDGTNEKERSNLTRVSCVCRIFHANENTLYVADQSVCPQLCSVTLRPSTFIPPIIFAAVQKPKPTKMLVLLQDVEASKGRIVADKYSRLLILDDNGRAYPEDCCQNSWPAGPGVCSSLLGIKVILPQFSPLSRTHDLVKLTGTVADLDERSALMWPACGSCGSLVTTQDKNVHHCAQCSKECKQLIVRMSLIVFVQRPDFPNNVSIRVKILHKTVEALLRTMPKEGQDIMVREAVGKTIGPIRCEVTASHGGKFVLNELPSSLWM